MYKRQDEDDIYKKFEETHFQRCYEISELKELLEQSGLVFDAVYDAVSYTHLDVYKRQNIFCVENVFVG